MPRDFDVVGGWHGTSYQVASVSSTADVERRFRGYGETGPEAADRANSLTRRRD